MCDRKSSPRPKPCGDAWCKPALDILQDMGVLTKMEQDGIVHSVTRGGLISPFGHKCVNVDGDAYGAVTGCKTYAIKRQIADEYLVRAAAKFPSVELKEGCEIVDAVYERSTNCGTAGVWKVRVRKDKNDNGADTISCTMLLICDGSTSYLAQKLGILPPGEQPQAVCSHAYISNHKWEVNYIYALAYLPTYFSPLLEASISLKSSYFSF